MIVTDASTLIIMTREFDPLTEVQLDPSDPAFKGEQAQISVGWGTKETQFHGKAGKAAAKAVGAPMTPIGPHDDRKVRLYHYFFLEKIDRILFTNVGKFNQVLATNV